MKTNMIRCMIGFAACAGAMSCVAKIATVSDVNGQTTIYEGGAVWNGTDFVRRDIAVRDGTIVPTDVVGESFASVDVSGKYITPPYANAHHHITNANDQSAWTFLEHGVFYVWNPNLISTSWTDASATYYARSDTYDVRTSLGGITEPGGHPEYLYVEILSQYAYQGYELEDFSGTAFHYGRAPEEIDTTLDLLVEQGAHFIKALLLFSEEYEKRVNDDAYYGQRGLNPNNFMYLVDAVHKRNLSIVVHVETPHDMQVAVAAGADMLAHLPGYTDSLRGGDIAHYSLSEEDAIAAAKSGIYVVPTYAMARYHYQRQADEGSLNTKRRDRHFSIQANNLRLIADAGVPILTGTDSAAHIYDEVNHWVEVGGLTTAQALKSVFQTGRYLFPGRKIGYLQTGYEADFLVLDGDPTSDIAHLSTISMRIKGGKLISAPAVE